MSEAQSEQVKYRIHGYHEAPGHYAARMAREHPGATPPTQKAPAAEARERLATEVRLNGEVIDFASITEGSRKPVVVDTEGSWRDAAPGEVPTGHISEWTCLAFARKGFDVHEPILEPSAERGHGKVVVTVPKQLAGGGSARIHHGLGGEVTVHAFRASGEGLGYLMATTLDSDSVHIEFYADTAFFLVERDS